MNFLSWLLLIVIAVIFADRTIRKLIDRIEAKSVERLNIKKSKSYQCRYNGLEKYNTEDFNEQLKELTEQGNMLHPHIVRVLETNIKRRLGLLPYQQVRRLPYNRYYKHGHKR